MKALLRKIRQILKDRRTRKIFTRFISTVAAIVVFVTTYALVLPAITMESQAMCGIEAHQHSDSCYEKRLTCGLEESETHTHTDSCYEKVLVCGKENHTHSTACYHLEKAAAGAPIEIAGVASTESAALAATETASSDPAASAAAETTSFDPASAAATDPQDDSSLFGTDTSSHAGTTPANTTSADTIDPATNSALTDTSNTEFTEDSADTESIADTEDTTNTEDKSSTGTPLDPEDNTAADPADTAATEASADFENQKDTSETSNADPSSADPASEDFSDASHTTTSDQPTTDTNDTTSQITADTPADTPDGTDNAATTAPADPANGATNAEPVSAGYVPALEELNFNTILNKNTTVYYHHQTSEDKPAEETTADDTNNQTMDDSGKQTAADTDNQTIDDGNDQTTADITDWKQTDKNTVLGENDLLRVYLAYTIPAGSLNETNPTARYRLPENIHLTDDQIDAINTNVNGIAAQYINYETLEITDLDAYNKTLGIEAVDGDRTPEDDLNEYLQNHDNQEFISATVRAEKVYAGQNLNSTDDQDSKDKENNEDDTAFNSVDQTDYLGTDLVFSFTPYTIQKNCHEYDSNGKPTKAGEKIKGWVVLDLTTDQLDWIKAADSKETDTADIIFAEEDKELKIKEISTTLILAPATESADKNKDDSAQSRNEGSSEDASTKKEETSDKKLDSSEEDSSSKTSAEISKEIDLSKYPAVTFNDKIIVNAGTLNSDTEAGAALESETELTVHVEADEGTFPEGTTMRLAEADDDAVAEAVQGTINGKTKGFHAVDISFWAAPNPADPESEPFEIEPLKPIRVSITSEAIRQAVEDNSTAPLVVHVEDVKTAASGVNSEDQDISGTSDTEAAEELASAADDSGPSATIMDTSETTAPVTSDKTSDTTDTLTFEAGTFSVYAIIYTVDFHWSKNGQDQTFSISGGSAISLSELLPIMEIVKDDPATPVNEVNSFIKEIDLVEFSNPDLVFVAKVSKATTVGTFKEEYGLNVQYSSDLSDAQIHEINEKKVEPEDWLLISLKPFESTETLTIHMTNGDIFSIHVTDAVVTTESDFLKYANSGRSFYLFTNSVLYDYYLKYDGGVEWEYTSARSDGGYLYDELGDDFVWTLKQNESGNWIIRNVGHSDYYITLKDSNHITSKDSNTAISMNPRNDTGRFDGFQIVNPGTSQAINFFYNGIWDYGFNTVLRNNNWGARMYLIPKAFEITYTQDNIQHGYVHFPYYTGTVATNESYQSFIIFTNTISAGEQSGYKVTASPEDGYHFIRWEASGEGTIQAWGTGNETNQSPAIQPIVTGGNVTLTAVFGKNPDVIFTQDDLSHGYVQYTSSTGTVKTKPGTPEFSVGTKTSGQTVYAISAVPETGYHFVEWQVANGSEKLTAWGSSGVVTKNNQIIQPYINGEGVRLKAVFAKNPVISVTQDDITKGHVKYNNGNTDTYTDNSNLTGEVLTSGPDSDNQYHSFGYITAEPEEGYRFVKWEVTGPGSLEDWGNDSTVNEKSLQIMPYIQNGNVSLKAIFEKIPPSISDLDPNSAAAKLVTELQEEMKKESAKMTKTAHVLDAEKRTYQIDMTASSERKVIGPTIELSFITDVSRSMWFPANIEKVTYKSNDNLQPDSGGSNLQNWLDRNGKNSDGSYKVFYMIADINESATMLAIYHEGGEWRTMDASYYDDKINGRHENYKEGRAATLYSDTMYYDSSLGWVIKTGADNDTIDAGHSKAYPITDVSAGREGPFRVG